MNDNFLNLIEILGEVVIKYNLPIFFSTHPRTRKKIEELNISKSDEIHFIKPIGFTDYIALQKNAFITLSDSGTIFEESAMVNFPAISLRSSTERPEASENGTIVIGNINKLSVLQSIEVMINTLMLLNWSFPEYKIKMCLEL